MLSLFNYLVANVVQVSCHTAFRVQIKSNLLQLFIIHTNQLKANSIYLHFHVKCNAPLNGFIARYMA